MEEGEEPPISKLFTIKFPMNKKENKDALVVEKPSDCNWRLGYGFGVRLLCGQLLQSH